MASEEGDDQEDDNLRDAVRELIDRAGGVSAAARLLGKGRNTIDQWFKGKSKIPLASAVDLARQTGVGLDALLLGRDDQPNSAALSVASGAEVPEGFVHVPVLQVRASAGPGQLAPQEQNEGAIVAFKEEWLRRLGLIPARAEAMTAVGDSMEPTIRDGDLLLVDRSIVKVVNHGIYVVVYNGNVLLKRMQMRLDGSITLISDNQAYQPETVPANDAAELIIEGRVRWFGRMI